MLLLEKKFIKKNEWEDSPKILKIVLAKKGIVSNFSFCSSEFSFFHNEQYGYNNSSNDGQVLLSSHDRELTMGCVCSEVRPHMGLDPGFPFYYLC